MGDHCMFYFTHKLVRNTFVHVLDQVQSGFKIQYYFIHQKYIQLEVPEHDFSSKTIRTRSRMNIHVGKYEYSSEM